MTAAELRRALERVPGDAEVVVVCGPFNDKPAEDAQLDDDGTFVIWADR